MFDITQRYSASGHADSVQFHDSFCDDSLRNFVQSFFFFFFLLASGKKCFLPMP